MAKALKQAAELALFDFDNPNVSLIPKDTKGTADGAHLAAESALQDGAELIIGPLFAQEVAAAAPVAVDETGVPAEDVEREQRIAEEQFADKPENIRPNIVKGKVDSWLKEVVLLRQVHVNADKYEGRTIDEIRAALAAKTGENIVIRRFTRFAVGD